MAVAKRQGKEKPTKIEQRKVWGPEWGPQVGQTALLAGPIYVGQAQGEEKTHKKRSQRARGSLSLPHMHTLSLSPLCIFWVSMPSHLKDVFSFIFEIKMICPRTITWTVQELWRTKGFNVPRFKSLLWWDRTKEITLPWQKENKF